MHKSRLGFPEYKILYIIHFSVIDWRPHLVLLMIRCLFQNVLTYLVYMTTEDRPVEMYTLSSRSPHTTKYIGHNRAWQLFTKLQFPISSEMNNHLVVHPFTHTQVLAIKSIYKKNFYHYLYGTIRFFSFSWSLVKHKKDHTIPSPVSI